MHLIPVRTPIINRGDDLVAVLHAHAPIEDGDIVAITSKIVATAEGAIIDLATVTPSDDARAFAEKTGRNAAFLQATLDETRRLNGRVIGSCPGALLTEVKPDPMIEGTILCANAGLDESNVTPGTAVGWPHDPAMSCKRLAEGLNRNCGILIIDSFCVPRRSGVTAFALAACGFDPLRSDIGRSDLFGRRLTVTVEAIGDQLATATAMIMGNADQATPIVIIRDHGIPQSGFCGVVSGIDPDRDMFRSMV